MMLQGRSKNSAYQRSPLSSTVCMDVTIYPGLVFVLTFFGLALSAWIGVLFSRNRGVEAQVREDFGIILAATLTLLGLIVGFTFSMGLGRYDQRKNYEEEEANAIGTEYARAGLLPAADAAKVRALLLNYLDQRILFYTTRDEQQLAQIDAQTAKLQAELWSPGTGSGLRATNARYRFGGFGHERCVELARLYTGSVVEPDPVCGVGSDGGDRHLLGRAGWIRGATPQSGV